MPVPLAATAANERAPALSPDGRWLAYTSRATGRSEVYVRPTSVARARRLQASAGGGTEPAWSSDGQRLFYRDQDDWMVEATVAADPYLQVMSRVRLFDASPYRAAPGWIAYAVAPDNAGFIMLRSTGFGRTETGSLVVVENWFRELRERAQ